MKLYPYQQAVVDAVNAGATLRPRWPSETGKSWVYERFMAMNLPASLNVDWRQDPRNGDDVITGRSDALTWGDLDESPADVGARMHKAAAQIIFDDPLAWDFAELEVRVAAHVAGNRAARRKAAAKARRS